MNIHCSNCDKVYDSKIESYDDHESGKCNWNEEDKKDYRIGFVSIFLSIGGLFVGMVATINTGSFFYFVAIALSSLIISQFIMYKVWTRGITVQQESNPT
jgi:hypothetical protein